MDACVEDDSFDNNSFCPKSDVSGISTSAFHGEEVTYKWNDITTEFIEACSQLELGELFHDVKYALILIYF